MCPLSLQQLSKNNISTFQQTFINWNCQDYIPSQADCPGYDIPQVEMEKMPKKIEEKADGYYPSGDGDQRIPGQKQGKIGE